MTEDVFAYVAQYSEEIKTCFMQLRASLYACGAESIEEKLWAKLPSYYVGARFVRLIPFKDHINVEASAITVHRAALSGYRTTPKGMLQIFSGQPLPEDTVLQQIFQETLCG